MRTKKVRWNMKWQRAVLTDESPFCKEIYDIGRLRREERRIILWVAITYKSLSALLFIRSAIHAQRYVDEMV